MNNKNKYRLECLSVGKFSLKEVLPDDPEVSSDTNNVVTIRLNQLVINFIN